MAEAEREAPACSALESQAGLWEAMQRGERWVGVSGRGADSSDGVFFRVQRTQLRENGLRLNRIGPVVPGVERGLDSVFGITVFPIN